MAIFMINNIDMFPTTIQHFAQNNFEIDIDVKQDMMPHRSEQ